MQHYYFDLHWDDETVIDEEGTGHFDDGSAIYYGHCIADRIARDSAFDRVRIHVRQGDGALLGVISPAPARASSARNSPLKDLVTRAIAGRLQLFQALPAC